LVVKLGGPTTLARIGMMKGDRLSGTGLEVSHGLTISRARETRHWRPMMVRSTLLTLTLLTSCLSPHSPDMLGI
jgi:hypothetical protein